MCARNSYELQGKEDLLSRSAELEEILHLERESLVTEIFGDYEEILAKKEDLLQGLFASIDDIYYQLSDEDKDIVEEELIRLQQINRGNMFLLHSYKLFHENVSQVIGMDLSAKEESPYQKSKKGSKGKHCLLDGQA